QQICDRLAQKWKSWLLFSLMTLFVLSLLIACAGPQVQKEPVKGVYHIVKKGETAYSISRAYSISLQELAKINNIKDVSNIKVGSVIFIPDAVHVIDDVMAAAKIADTDSRRSTAWREEKVSEQEKPSTPVLTGPSDAGREGETSGTFLEPRGVKEDKRPTVETKDQAYPDKSKLLWPVKGKVKTSFGAQPNKTYHNWIKIACPAGTPVKAAARGTVIFSANLKDFGETIIIRHSNGFATVYTHLKKRHVKADQTVKKGQTIALAGEMDEKGGVYINFEIRRNGKAQNPLPYLP
ncbi:MAG: M23 family metallopeptidase, partial [Smithellaceae bacterium]|nr:M23 family metallopeptidase [Smithellaceae bacterium]